MRSRRCSSSHSVSSSEPRGRLVVRVAMCSPPRCCSPSGLSTLRGLGGIHAPVDRCRFRSLLCFFALSQRGQLYPDGFSSHTKKFLQGPLKQIGKLQELSPISTLDANLLWLPARNELHERKRLPVLLSSFCRPSPASVGHACDVGWTK